MRVDLPFFLVVTTQIAGINIDLVVEASCSQQFSIWTVGNTLDPVFTAVQSFDDVFQVDYCVFTFVLTVHLSDCYFTVILGYCKVIHLAIIA